MILEEGKEYYINPGEVGIITLRDSTTKEFIASNTLDNTSDYMIKVTFKQV